MHSLPVKCDRCKRLIDGMRFDNATAGFYDLTTELWSKFANPGEENICDDCMHRDSRYQAVYQPEVLHKDRDDGKA